MEHAMADPKESVSTAAEERQKNIDAKTSFGQYMLKELQMTGLPLLGGGAGWAATWGLLKNAKINEFVAKRLSRPKWIEFGVTGKTIFISVGVFIGTFIAGLFNTYGHWKNSESEKLAVNEINQDVANLVTERSKFADTLNRQEALIKDLVAKHGQEKSFSERAAAPSEASADMARG